MELVRPLFRVASFYLFNEFSEESLGGLLVELQDNAIDNELMGTILLAKEGMNGTICGTESNVQNFIKYIENKNLGANLELKFSWTTNQAFRRLKIRRKSEIVTMGVPWVNPLSEVGMYVEAEEWNNMIEDTSTLVIDTRNHYEVSIGSFEGSLNPNTNCFRDFPDWVDNTLPLIIKESRPKQIAMFCTGGIRCEKATSYMIAKGYNDIFHLRGGILKYLEDVPQSESMWKGECFVFDQRVSLNHHLSSGTYKLCYACGMPLSVDERNLLTYIPGVQCNYCIDLYSDEDRKRFADRQRQLDQIHI